MKNFPLAVLVNRTDNLEAISTDVFDTLLLRNSRSERARIVMGERLFSRQLEQEGRTVETDLLAEARMQAQRLAFRGLSLRRRPGEVRLVDIISRQLALLGLPQTLIGKRYQIELEVEKTSLTANLELAKYLRTHRDAGVRILAISDTTLSTQAVRELIHHFHGPDLIDAVYSSADVGLTKRAGGLFAAAMKSEGISPHRLAHIGDDLLADVKIPSAMGINACHAPRPVIRKYIRYASGISTEVGKFLRSQLRAAKLSTSYGDSAGSFGRHIFGPIITQFCLLIWLYVLEAGGDSNPCLMFCARGGVGIREAFERVVLRLGLPIQVRRENIMISRLIAARAALLAQDNSAAEELDREFSGSSMAEVAAALGGKTYELPTEWHQPMFGPTFVKLLFDKSGTEVLANIDFQHSLFVRHFEQLIGDSDRIILCDTGLYGSTQRLLASAFPDVRLETIQFARSNYKGHSEEHFPKVSGLLVEQNFYSPLNVRSVVLRYWHLIEGLFEPDVPSVRLFFESDDGQIRANCGDITFGVVDPTTKNALLAGALSYIDSLAVCDGAVALNDAESAWRQLRRAITRPTEADLRCLGVADRSVDFGRAEVLSIFVAEKQGTLVHRIKSLRSRLWREGAISREFPMLRHVLLPILSISLSIRGLIAREF
ncbi:HAD family hydrolase [Bradyrhizobium sp. 76]|uniref:HAD family hydrolase n=1 Tax=Bradyrhizobium sp. 76 TaxID=2782680 RepID=UPI001FFBE931|nr:HAD family hydrolase [Bradyrhizobium sp. 76]MCK1404969.1 hydrolase [Bradyrhizobium sp. 76]